MKKQFNILAIAALFVMALFIGACGGGAKQKTAEEIEKAKQDSISKLEANEPNAYTSENLILGRWEIKKDALEFEFTKDGKCMQYENGKLQNSATYEIIDNSEGPATLNIKNKDTKETYKIEVNEAELTIIDKGSKMIFSRKIE